MSQVVWSLIMPSLNPLDYDAAAFAAREDPRGADEQWILPALDVAYRRGTAEFALQQRVDDYVPDARPGVVRYWIPPDTVTCVLRRVVKARPLLERVHAGTAFDGSLDADGVAAETELRWLFDGPALDYRMPGLLWLEPEEAVDHLEGWVTPYTTNQELHQVFARRSLENGVVWDPDQVLRALMDFRDALLADL